MVRVTLSKIIIIIFSFIILLLLWKLINLNNENYKFTCNKTESYLRNLENLLQKVHNILENAKLTHILCYGTLWGQIRISKIFPWSKKAEFCIFNDELEKIDKDYFNDIFTRNSLNINYNTLNGYYKIEEDYSEVIENDPDDNEQPFVEIIIFKNDESQNVYKRVGLIHRLLPPSCEWTRSLDCFPSNLIQKPLPIKPLGNFEYSVAMGGIDIQKYHYAENWWKEVRLKNC